MIKFAKHLKLVFVDNKDLQNSTCMLKSSKRIIVANEGMDAIGEIQSEYLKEMHGVDIKIVTQQQAIDQKHNTLLVNSIFMISPLAKVPPRPTIKKNRAEVRLIKRSKA